MNYADPSYPIDLSLLGNGNKSKTEFTQSFDVKSTLPCYEVHRVDTGENIELDDLTNRVETEEDYRNILLLREKDVTMRVAPQGPYNPSEILKFRFLDTPGLNNTNNGDNGHAASIISEMTSTQTFNLIIITVSYKGVITEEQQLVLEYYAKVFQGLHSRIIFLYTHVGYFDCHHSNTKHALKLQKRNRDLSRLFRQHDFNTSMTAENLHEYPSFTIDLSSKKRPVINCLIRNTIREILKTAIQSPVIFETSIQNIERVRTITHPSKFNDEERKRIQDFFLAEA
ncbi:hypothetical protein BGZ93_011145 [Podila epicladia]|nr:hypothetical protein BGZ92_002703 [Podila epicladia]KAG0087106.1 hypothetical protein BGZ93_011145 [Podila epicladia]